MKPPRPLDAEQSACAARLFPEALRRAGFLARKYPGLAADLEAAAGMACVKVAGSGHPPEIADRFLPAAVRWEMMEVFRLARQPGRRHWRLPYGLEAPGPSAPPADPVGPPLIALLSPAHRAAVELTVIAGHGPSEAARMAGITPNLMGKHIRRGLAQLRARLSPLTPSPGR